TEPLPIYPALLTDDRSAIACPTVTGEGLIGTGPFKLESFESDRVILKRQSHYWKGPSPAVDSIEFRVAGNSAEIAAGLRNGEFDIASDLLPQDLEEILRDRKQGAALVEAPKKNSYFVLFNINSEISKNLELRRALAGILRTPVLVRHMLGRFA